MLQVTTVINFLIFSFKFLFLFSHLLFSFKFYREDTLVLDEERERRRIPYALFFFVYFIGEGCGEEVNHHFILFFSLSQALNNRKEKESKGHKNEGIEYSEVVLEKKNNNNKMVGEAFVRDLYLLLFSPLHTHIWEEKALFCFILGWEEIGRGLGLLRSR